MKFALLDALGKWGSMRFGRNRKFGTLAHPIKKVQLVKNTQTDDCDTREECCGILVQLQRMQIYEDRMNDINYNFMIGGDGNVYEGLGWSKKTQQHPSWPTDVSDGLVVGLIGSYSVPPECLLQTFERFVNRYVSEGLLSSDVVAINV